MKNWLTTKYTIAITVSKKLMINLLRSLIIQCFMIENDIFSPHRPNVQKKCGNIARVLNAARVWKRLNATARMYV